MYMYVYVYIYIKTKFIWYVSLHCSRYIKQTSSIVRRTMTNLGTTNELGDGPLPPGPLPLIRQRAISENCSCPICRKVFARHSRHICPTCHTTRRTLYFMALGELSTHPSERTRSKLYKELCEAVPSLPTDVLGIVHRKTGMLTKVPMTGTIPVDLYGYKTCIYYRQARGLLMQHFKSIFKIADYGSPTRAAYLRLLQELQTGALSNEHDRDGLRAHHTSPLLVIDGRVVGGHDSLVETIQIRLLPWVVRHIMHMASSHAAEEPSSSIERLCVLTEQPPEEAKQVWAASMTDQTVLELYQNNQTGVRYHVLHWWKYPNRNKHMSSANPTDDLKRLISGDVHTQHRIVIVDEQTMFAQT